MFTKCSAINATQALIGRLDLSKAEGACNLPVALASLGDAEFGTVRPPFATKVNGVHPDGLIAAPGTRCRL